MKYINKGKIFAKYKAEQRKKGKNLHTQINFVTLILEEFKETAGLKTHTEFVKYMLISNIFGYFGDRLEIIFDNFMS